MGMSNAVARTRAMPSGAKIKRGIGLVLAGLLAAVVAFLLAAIGNTQDAVIGYLTAAVMLVGLLSAWGAIMIGVGLLLWGLFSD